MHKRVLVALALLLAPAAAAAQDPAVSPVLPAESVQIATAVAPLPEEFRADATVLGYRAGSSGLVPLRPGDGPYVCLASLPGA